MRRKRLFWRLFLAYLAVTLAALLAVDWYESGIVPELFSRRTDLDLESQARLCAAQIDGLLARGDAAAVDNRCKELGQLIATRVTVILPSGQVIGDSAEDPRQMENHAYRPEIREALSGGKGGDTRKSETLATRLQYVAVPIVRQGKVAAVVRTAQPVEPLRTLKASLQLRVAAIALAAVAGLALVSYWLARRIGRPLEDLKAGALRFAGGELGHRLAASDFEEIAVLAEAMNQMAAELDGRLREALRQQNEQRAILGSMDEGVLAVDRDGTILNLNEACAVLLDAADADRLRGRRIHEVIRKPDLLEFVEGALASSNPLERDILLRGAMEDRWLRVHTTTLHDAVGQKIGVLVVLHDTTRLRRLENVRRDFVANVSHELRTPLTSIKGFVETLLDGAIDDHDNARRFLDIALRQINRVNAIIEDLLVLSRLEKGAEEQIVPTQDGAVCPVIRAAVEMCEQKATEKGVRIDWECPDDLKARINAPLVEQAVVNLLDNAVKYSDSGSVVRVRAARESDEAVIRVEDQGCGIEAKHLPRIFERFYRADKARSRELGGTGLGLAIVKHITLAHRGTVTVESTVGVGSVFTIRLPYAAAEPAPAG